MDQVTGVLLQNGLSGVVILVLLFVTRQLWSDGKDKDKALAEEKDKRLSDALSSQQAVFAAIGALKDLQGALRK